jgi:hypothetical protein
MDSRSTDIASEDPGEDNSDEPDIPEPPPADVPQLLERNDTTDSIDEKVALKEDPIGLAAPTTTSQTLRPRGTRQPAMEVDTSQTTGRAALFAGRRTSESLTAQSSTATAEAILDQQRAEQDALSESILKMAGALKKSSQRFSSTLEQDRGVLDRAGEGMDRSERGMDAASRRMGTLKSLTEGKGWWGRMILFAMVYGMMLVLVLLVFVLPKFRF